MAVASLRVYLRALKLSVSLLFLLGSFGCNPPTVVTECPRSTTRPSQAANLQQFNYTAPKMGTVFHMTFYAPDQASADRAANAGWARVNELNAMLSDYDPNSELSKLGQQTLDGPMKQPTHVSDDLYDIIELSIDAAKMSDGTFDITVGPLTQLFRRSRRLEIAPTPARIAEAKKSVGYQYLKLDPDHHAVQLLAAKMRLDVGGIAKGYTSEAILKLLREKFGITRALCGAAGDIAVGDPPPGREFWTVALENLDATEKSRGAFVQLHNYGISTSGDTERFVIIDGVRYSHIIDPRTGIGLTNRINCSAIAPNDILADWLAAAVCILGPERGLELTESTAGAACRITQMQGDGRVKVWESKRFKEFAAEPPATSTSTPTRP